MYGWTEFDMVRIEEQLKEERLRRAATMPKLPPRQPIRTALSWTLMTLARHLSPEKIAVPTSQSLAISAES